MATPLRTQQVYCYFCLLLTVAVSCTEGTLNVNGSVRLDLITFYKIISTQPFVLVKFDKDFTYGLNLRVFQKLVEVSLSYPELLVATVEIQGEYITILPNIVLKLLIPSHINIYVMSLIYIHHSFLYISSMLTQRISDCKPKIPGIFGIPKIRHGAPVELEGCLAEYDSLVSEFLSTMSSKKQKKLLGRARKKVSLTQNEEVQFTAKFYTKMLSNIAKQGISFVEKQCSHLNRLVEKPELSEQERKKADLKLNVLSSFSPCAGMTVVS
ncbi:endoplasmic reticulum resident protein 29-like [Protopterus annectens]|uniref:endoplasmic reticulum resident protein 29-like n=1 Tax=Protopterus annectens TaxID=7888 RepID=UPI001CF98FAC|nr:endoplasmic reticulum resident protein 29-like [Protopterus annectens]